MSTAHPEDTGATVGLAPGTRYRCEGCGNLTRFDVTTAVRSTVFWHVAVSGEGAVEGADVADRVIESVACRWCGAADRVVTEPAPAAGEAG